METYTTFTFYSSQKNFCQTTCEILLLRNQIFFMSLQNDTIKLLIFFKIYY